MICFHRYPKWAIVERGDTRKNEQIIGWYLVQERTCAKCGYTERKQTTQIYGYTI